jgi:hypothetical protein
MRGRSFSDCKARCPERSELEESLQEVVQKLRADSVESVGLAESEGDLGSFKSLRYENDILRERAKPCASAWSCIKKCTSAIPSIRCEGPWSASQ